MKTSEIYSLEIQRPGFYHRVCSRMGSRNFFCQYLTVLMLIMILGLQSGTQIHAQPIDPYPYPGHFHKKPPPQHLNRGLSPEAFSGLLRELGERSLDGGKLQYLREVLPSIRLSSRQVVRIAETFHFDSNRLEFAGLAIPRTVDPENLFLVEDCFDFRSNAEEFREMIVQIPPTGGYHPCLSGPMSEFAFARLTERIQNRATDSGKVETAKEILSGSWVSANQVFRLCGLLSFDSRRLELAKFAYSFCIDPENYWVVSESFEFDSHKRELMAYIQSLTSRR